MSATASFPATAFERDDLVGDGRRQAGHDEVATGTETVEVDGGAVDEEPDRRARAREPGANAVVDRKHGLLADERPAEDVRERALRERRIDHHRVLRRALAPQRREDRVEDVDPLERVQRSQSVFGGS
jgi:hypothetical protein